MCTFCDNEIKCNFARHLKTHHGEEQEVLAFLRTKGAERLARIKKLRKAGNYSENRPVYEKGDDLLTGTPKMYSCSHCLGKYRKESLFRHVKKCFFNTNKRGRSHALADAQTLEVGLRVNTDEMGDLKRNVFPRMQADDIARVAKSDELICQFALRYRKNHRQDHLISVVVRHVRRLAEILISLRQILKDDNISLLNSLRPKNFDAFVKAVKMVCKYDPNTEKFGRSSFALQIGTQIKQCCDVANALGLKKEFEQERLDFINNLKRLFEDQWQFEVSVIALENVHANRWNKPLLLPTTEDLQKLKNYLSEKSNHFSRLLKEDKTSQIAFSSLQKLLYVQLILLNRKRVGELQRIRVDWYLEHKDKEISSEFDKYVNDAQRLLMRSFRRIVIRGKRGRGVPVLFTLHMVNEINFLLKVRNNFVLPSNKYLFASLSTDSPLQGTQVIKEVAKNAKVSNINAITSTRLRKHLATVCQILDLSDNDREQLSTFLGHSRETHEEFYRRPDQVYQTAVLSKLLLIAEGGNLTEIQGKRLDEINDNIDDIIEDDNEADVDDPSVSVEEVPLVDNPSASVEDVPQPCAEKTSSSSGKSQKRKRRVLKAWSKEERDIVLSHFQRNIKSKKAPKKAEVVEVQEKFPVLKERKWESIKVYICNQFRCL